jgi:hypothetical protein
VESAHHIHQCDPCHPWFPIRAICAICGFLLICGIGGYAETASDIGHEIFRAVV